ncbi:D-3-phosphoglycerate dehydrogenase [Halodesulfurarchaeum formicicum]|uniref:D-3-phosphoglycerate dehydrogenase n=1 Tax=Halodesulfurarchaeum formicicum TaxID=1873524 RepID=A0A1D8S2Z8_9EURY|nr:D-2-hydroxyacid dehydrogenase [Halodesulfurarchaeum formicicum]AOW79734.1 D-3-phosphoglycerate dehydrogenase [Halodesulfurarchaeum formicicum]
MTVDIVVLRQQLQGLDGESYAAALEERLPEAEISVARTPSEERALLRTAQIAAGTNIDPEAVERAENLELFAGTYAGTEHLPLDVLEDHGIAVTNGSGVHGPNIAEYVLGSILSFARGFPTAWRQKERREWQAFQTHELQGSTVTVIGLGAIGQAVLQRLEPFGVHTIGLRYTPEKGGPADEIAGLEGEALHDALARSDYVVVASPLTETTRGLIDETALETMSPDSVLVNIARGPIVETDALVTELQRNGIRGAALDVTDPEPLPADHELWGLDNVFLTPHHAGFTPNYWERRADILAENVEIAAETGSFDGLVNQVR